MNAIDLTGRVAIVTGGGSGIGYATAERFLKSGAAVEIWGRDPDKLERAAHELAGHGPLTARSVDVAEADRVEAAARDAEARLGRVDILFNCAGVALGLGPLTAISMENWHANIAVNLNGTFYCCRAFLPGMIQRGYGRIVNTASMAGKDGNPQQGAYSAAKGGVIALTKSLGKEVATTGVVVNCIAPTLFDTPIVEAALTDPVFRRGIEEKIPMRRIGRPGEAAAMVAWLASEECSFTTGFIFDLSGGRATY